MGKKEENGEVETAGPETQKKDVPPDVLKIQVPKKLPSLNSPPKARFAPVAKPAGINPVEITVSYTHLTLPTILLV